MKKKCLFFAIALLAGAYTCKCHAEGENTETEQTSVDPTNIKTYGELKKAVDKVKSIPELQKTVNDKKEAVTTAENAVTAANLTVQEKELDVEKKQAVVKDKELVVETKKAAVVPLQEVLDAKTAAIVPLQKDVDNANTVLAGLMANPQYPTSGTKTGKMDNPFLVEINNFLTVVRHEMETPGSSGVTKEKAGEIKIYYRVKKNITKANNKIITTFLLDITTADFAGLESQTDKGWNPINATIAFDAELVKEEYDGETFEYFSYPNDIALKYNGSNVVLGNGLLTLSIYYCPVDVEADSESGKKEITFGTSEQTILKSGLGMSGDEVTFLGFVDAMAEITTPANFPPVEYDEPILNENYQTWLNQVQAAKDDLGYKDETTGEWVVGGKSKLLEDAKADEAIAQAAVNSANVFVTEAQNAVKSAEAEVTAAEAALREAKEKVLTAQTKVETAKGEVTTAEAAVTAANEYKTLTITGNNEFVVTGTLAAEWPADGVIRGNGNKIVNDANTPLFTHNYGSISGLIAPNGRIASYNETGAQVRDCIVKVSSAEYRAYDDNSAVKLYSKLDDAVYSMREYFGYDAKTATATGKVTSDTKLYKAQNKVTSSQPLTGSYVNITDAGEVRYASSVSTENTVLYLDDIAVKSDNKNVTAANVAVLQSEVTDAQTGAVTKTYSCKKIELVDGSSRKEFYMPYSVTADELSYSRTTTTNKVPVCMPFGLNADIKTLIAKNVGTDVSNVFFYTLNEVKDGIVWFTPVSSIEANKPGLIAFKDGVELGGQKNLFAGLTASKVEATPDIASLSAAPLNGGDEGLFGNYKPGQVSSVLVQAHAGAGNAAYCYQGGKLVRMKEDANGSTKLNQFRSYVIMKEPAASPYSLPDSFEIGFLDEDGNEVTGIGSVESGKSDNGFKAVGGNGVIAISADKACDVKVYTAGGSLVKTVRVESGRTTLPFSAGMYIVNQTKVVVK